MTDSGGTRQGTGSTVRAEATRAAILEHAARLFATKGFEGTSFGDVAASLGLTRPAVYHYFSSKEDILATLISATSGSAAEKLTAIRNDPAQDSVGKLRSVTAALVRDRLDSPEKFRMLERSEDSLPEPVGSEHRSARRVVLAEVAAVLRDGIVAGTFRACDERIGALSVLGMCNWVAWWYRPDTGPSAGEVIAAIADNAVAMFASTDNRASRAPGVAGAFDILRQDVDRLEKVVAQNEVASTRES